MREEFVRPDEIEPLYLRRPGRRRGIRRVHEGRPRTHGGSTPRLCDRPRCYSRPWSASQWRTELAADDRTHLVATTTMSSLMPARCVFDELHITTVAVDLTTKARASAPALYRVAAPRYCRRCHRRDPRGARPGAPHPAALWPSRFAPAGIRSRYYDRPTDDAVIMWLHDLDSPEIVERLDVPTRSSMEPLHDRRPHSRHRDQL